MAELRLLIGKNNELIGTYFHGESGDIAIYAFAAILHSFYTGIEGIFTRIAKKIDESVPGGNDSHARLLERMTKTTNRRPAVLSEDLAKNLKSYKISATVRHA